MLAHIDKKNKNNALFLRNDRVTIQEREKILQESEVSEEKMKKLTDDRKRTAAKVMAI